MPAGTLPCPYTSAGTISNTFLPGGTTASPATYLCTGNLTITNHFAAFGPVVIYQEPSLSAPTPTLDLGGLTMSPKSFFANPADLQILKAGAGTVAVDRPGKSVEFTGILYAPGSSLDSPGCDMTIAGSITVDTFVCAGPANALTIAYDEVVSGQETVQGLLSDQWSVADYQEIATPASL